MLQQTPKLVFGSGCLTACRERLLATGKAKVFVVTSPSNRVYAERLVHGFPEAEIDVSIASEPTVGMFLRTLEQARRHKPSLVIGLGGGSPLDVAKLVAAFVQSDQPIHQAFGTGLLRERIVPLWCLPTTAGTGSEVSPNAVLLDESDAMKKGVISPYLVPDATFIDPELTMSVPASVTAATGLDALTHCIEAYTNKFAHPLVDMYALEGVRLITAALPVAVREPRNLEAREKMALGSLYGGLCLGPVNTAAVHALSYPLGGMFHVAHGHSNALLLPHVMRFNLPCATDRSAQIALAMGAKLQATAEQTALVGLEILWGIIRATGLEMRMKALGIAWETIPSMSASAMTVTRLLKNNPREMTLADAEQIYRDAYCAK